MYLSRRMKIPFHFMGAREIFEQGHGLRGLLLQKAGVFSIDREGTDLRAIKEALRILAEGRFPLVIFPEGEIYHLHDKLTPLNDGAATIALRSAKKVAKDKRARRVLIVPTALRYTYTEDIAPLLPEAMARLEAHILWAPQTHLNLVERIYKFGEAALSLKEKEHLGYTLSGALPERLQRFRELLLGQAEEVYGRDQNAQTHPERVRRLRGRIREIILSEDRPGTDGLRECFRQLDRIYLAVQLYSYPGQYLREHPSVDRVAETILKLEEDVFGKSRPKGQRRADVTLCAPIDVTGLLDAYRQDAKGTCHQLTERIATAIQGALEDSAAAP
jgi:1-acyl-sn-glycerol-3-phosphate acyltransferase